MNSSPDLIRNTIDSVYRAESRRILATLIRLLGDFEAAEEAMHDAFAAAMEQWSREGVPANPRAWLVSTGRFKAIDTMRRRARFDTSPGHVLDQFQADTGDLADQLDEGVEDDRLRLIFTCCHPALSPDAQIALTLREVCGLTTEEIAHAFLTPASTIAQRIVRAKAKIRDARIPYQIPSQAELPDRLSTVLHVVYLVFNEGYSASSGASLTRSDLSDEAIRLGRLLMELLLARPPKADGPGRPAERGSPARSPKPDRPARLAKPGGPATVIEGLLALMLLQESRRIARTSPSGELILLDNQDRSLWNRDQIAEGLMLVQRALSSGRTDPYTIQAAIAAVHAEASRAETTDWARIVVLYDMLLRGESSPVIELNRAVAVAMRDGPQAGLDLIDAILTRGDLSGYQFAHSARADLYRRLGNKEEARASYVRALSLTRQEPERRFLEGRLRTL